MKINNENIIDKIIKLKFKHRYLKKFTKKLDKDNISFLKSYVIENLNDWEKLDVLERDLYNRIKCIINSYDIFNKEYLKNDWVYFGRIINNYERRK